MIRCCFVKRFLIIAVSVITIANYATAGAYDTLRPKFNYALLKGLKNSGEKNVLNLPVGPWVEYYADSTSWKESIDRRDAGNNFFPPHRIILIKCVGEYVEGKKNGLWTYYRSYDNKLPVKWELMETWNFAMGGGHGMQRSYFRNGEVMEEWEYQNGKPNGAHTMYYRNGKVKEYTTYVDGKATGKSEEFSPDGVLLKSVELQEGMYHGLSREYYPNGQLRNELEYKMGSFQNYNAAYTRYGAPLDRGTFKNGNGTYYEYDESGTVARVGEMKNSRLNGTFREYYVDGVLKHESTFRNDTMRGFVRDFFPNGGLFSISSMVDGWLDGPVINYYPSGKIKSETIYKKGKIWSAVYANDTAGRKLDCGNIKMGTGVIITYDDSGRLALKEHHAFGFIEGLQEKFHPNGNLAYSLNYIVDLPHGEYKGYHENGKISDEFTYSEGMLDGYGRIYHSNGVVWKEMYYYRDRLWEAIAIRDSSGRKLNVGTFRQGCGNLNDYYPGGNLFSSREMFYGLAHGRGTKYYESGKKYGDYEYYNDQIVGTQKEYFQNGQVAVIQESNFNSNKENVSQFHRNGQLWTIWEYDDGLLWEVGENFDVNGMPHYKGTFSKGTGTVLRYNDKDEIIYEYKYLNGNCMNCDGDTIDLDDVQHY